jgi:PiT family inorganic phosphate transporter
VRWGVAGNVAIAWLITIPASAAVAAIFYWLISGHVVRALVGLVIVAALVHLAGRTKR